MNKKSKSPVYLIVLISLLATTASFSVYEIFKFKLVDSSIIFVVGGAAGIALTVMAFLQSFGNSTVGTASPFNRIAEESARNSRQIQVLKSVIDELTEGEKSTIKNRIAEEFGRDNIRETIIHESSTLVAELQRRAGMDHLSELAETLVGRLSDEVSNLRVRSNVNLSLGAGITISGLILLWLTISSIEIHVLTAEISPSESIPLREVFFSVLPRLSLVVFIEIFAYFFLRLYKSNLAEVKYMQNEITNIEAKMIALHVSIVSQNQASLSVALDSLSRTERNFVLEKGQSTVELEKTKASLDLAQGVLKLLPDLVKGKSG